MSSRQPCIVLAGGLGTRLRSAVADLPKCLAPVGRRSFIDFQIDALLAAGIDDVILSLGHKAEMVVESVERRHAGRPVRFAIESTPLGTGGAIAAVLDQFDLDEAIVANGDTYLDGDLSKMLPALQRDRGELFRMALVELDDRLRFGGVRVDDGGRVAGFVAKGQQGPGEINAGLYRLCRAALPASREGTYSLESDVLPGLASAGSVTAARIDGSFIDIGVPEDYHRFCRQHGG